jgi:hypothetical protein
MKKTKDPDDRTTTQVSPSTRIRPPRRIAPPAPREPDRPSEAPRTPSKTPDTEGPPGPDWTRFGIQQALLGSLLTCFGALIAFVVITGGDHVDRAWQAIVVLGIVVLALAGVGSNLKSILPRLLRKLADWLESDAKEDER